MNNNRYPHPETDLLVITKPAGNNPPAPYRGWLPGESGNPAGRPKMPVSLVQIIKEKLIEHPEEGAKIVSALFQEAHKPNLEAIKILLERIDGKVAQDVNIRGVIAHVGNEYAMAALEYDRQQLQKSTQSTQLALDNGKGEDSEAK